MILLKNPWHQVDQVPCALYFFFFLWHFDIQKWNKNTAHQLLGVDTRIVQRPSVYFVFTYTPLKRPWHCLVIVKQRPVFSLGVPTVTHAWNKKPVNKLSSIGCRSCETIMSHESVCFSITSDAFFETSKSKSEVLNRNQIRGNLQLSPKLRHFRVSRFSQCFILY